MSSPFFLSKFKMFKFVVLLIFYSIPLIPLYFFGQKPLFAFYNSTKKDATIVKCHVLRSRSGSNINRSWAPVAKSVDGDIVKGSFGFRKKSSCQEDIGKSVSVYISNINPKKSQINTFFQLWFRAILSIGISIIFYVACYKGYQKKKST